MNQCLSLPSSCRRASPYPSFRDQTEWAADYFSLPQENEVRWFNPTIASFHGTWLITRRAHGKPQPLGQNTIVMFRLEDKRAVQRVPVDFLRQFQLEHWEDPRAAILTGQLYISCCNFRVSQNYRAHQILARIGSQRYAETAHIIYGRNASNMDQNRGHEKNWVWFDHPTGWHLVYEPWPHHVVRAPLGHPSESYISPKTECPWNRGQMRGGTPPVLVDGLYWSFFHSSLDRVHPDDPRRRYFMGAYTFKPDPPFPIHSMTIDPLLTGSEADGGTLPVIFPGGAIYRNNQWLVVFGVNDRACGWVEIPMADLQERMIEL